MAAAACWVVLGVLLVLAWLAAGRRSSPGPPAPVLAEQSILLLPVSFGSHSGCSCDCSSSDAKCQFPHG